MTWRKKISLLRRYAPPSGKQYELFDTSAFLFLFGLVGYVLFQPPAGLLSALAAPLQAVSETQLGYALTMAGAIGVTCSYFPEYLKLGFLVPRIAAMFMTLNFLISLLVLTVNAVLMVMGWDFIRDTDLSDTFRVAFLYSLIFGWVTRRLSRDETE